MTAIPTGARPGRLVAAAACMLAGLGLAGCATGTDAANPPPTTTATGSAATLGTPAAAVSADVAWGHVHNLTLDGDRLLLGTHEGLWEQRPGQQVRLLSHPPFDVMGFALAEDRALASGHPGEGQDLPGDLGLLKSTDDGRTWESVSLLGEVDFHRLRTSGDVVLGLSAHDGALLRSTDGGATWTELGTLPLVDLAVDPNDPHRVVATTQSGPVASSDGGATFAPLDQAPLLALLAWTDGTLYGVAPDGAVHASTDGGITWKPRGTAGGQPAAIAADADRVVVLVEDSVEESVDGGTTFGLRLTAVG